MVTVAPSGVGHVVVEDFQVQGPSVVAIVSGGKAGKTYKLTCKVDTSDGRTFIQTAELPVV